MPKNKTVARLTNRFNSGKCGLCEAYLFEFQEVRMGEPRSLTIAAARLEDALSHLREDSPEFQIKSVQNLGVIVMVSGSPLD
jgi:hypothetical protein